MGDDEPTAPHDDYDLLTHYEAGQRLVDSINYERQRCDDSDGAEVEQHRLRLAELEEAQRRHRECRPADRPTFFNAAGQVDRIDTVKHRGRTAT